MKGRDASKIMGCARAGTNTGIIWQTVGLGLCHSVADHLGMGQVDGAAQSAILTWLEYLGRFSSLWSFYLCLVLVFESIQECKNNQR